jgi:hypothetical protein
MLLLKSILRPAWLFPPGIPRVSARSGSSKLNRQQTGRVWPDCALLCALTSQTSSSYTALQRLPAFPCLCHNFLLRALDLKHTCMGTSGTPVSTYSSGVAKLWQFSSVLSRMSDGIWHSHNGSGYGKYCLLGYNAVQYV